VGGRARCRACPGPGGTGGLPARGCLLPGPTENEACLLRRSGQPVCGSVGCRLPFLVVSRVAGVLPLVAVALALAGCSGGGGGAGAAVKAKPSCPTKAWQRLANQIHAPVYCPRWMPDPLDGVIRGRWHHIRSV